MQPVGPVPARIAIIGEAPGAEEERRGEPFVGASGSLLNNLLQKAGISRASCFITNVCNDRPPANDIGEWLSDNKRPPEPNWEHLYGKWAHPNIIEGRKKLLRELEEVKPDLIIVLGSTPLWALTGNSGILKWRGSRLSFYGENFKATVLPSIHPAAALREMSLAPVLLMDFKRALALLEGRQTPRIYDFKINPSFSETVEFLTGLLARADALLGGDSTLLLSGDLETRLGHIACFGIAWSKTQAFCIPYLELNKINPFYWPVEEEAMINHLLIQLFTHEKIVWVGQNFLYDCQYFHRFIGVVPNTVWDTMIGHHSIYSNMRKGLDFLSSMYAHDHVYWKDEIKEWDPAVGEKQFWTYNCKDACITYEVFEGIQIEQCNEAVSEHFLFQQSLFHPVLRMMNRGIKMDTGQRYALRKELEAASLERQINLEYMVGHEINPRSSKKLIELFYHDLRIPGIRSMTTDNLTVGSPALAEISNRHPVLNPLCQTIAELRSISVFLNTFIAAELDSDGRMRCSFSIAGPTTFRFSSSENAFGSGMNLQNIPIAEKIKIKGHNNLSLPNIRKLFVPDAGYTFFDMDLDRADLQVVVWEADDSELKLVLRSGLDMHLVNACTIFDIKGIPYDELSETHHNYREHRGRIGEPSRNKAKMGVHATNYGVGDYKLAAALGITVREAALFRSRWFGAHPGIRRWHLRVETSATTDGFITNPFGAKFHILGRFDLPECLAWGPQSTVAGVINRALVNIDRAEQRGETSVQLLLQVHDSLAGQFLTVERDKEEANLRRLAQITIPYPEPLIIPVGINCSTQSWGHCK
jgi:DNA polymerase